MKARTLIHFLSILGLLSLTISIAMSLQVSPAMNYEISIYSSLPVEVWGLFIFGAAIGTFVVILCATMREEDRKWWVLGGLILVISITWVLTLPVVRGYPAYGRGDPLTHIGEIRDIILYGQIGSSNFYPVTHILGAELSQVLDLSPTAVAMLIPPYLSLLSMLFYYVLTRTIFKSRLIALFCLPISAILFYSYYHVGLFPAAFSLFYLPFVFFVYFKSSKHNKKEYRALLLVLMVLYPLLHPLTALILILFLVVMEVSKKWPSRFLRSKEKRTFRYTKPSVSLNPAFLSFIVFFIWLSSFSIMAGGIKRVASSITGGLALESVTGMTAEKLSLLGMSGYQFLELFIRMYADNLIPIMLSLVAVVLIFKRSAHHKMEESLFEAKRTCYLFATSIVVFIFLLLNTAFVLSPNRIIDLNFGMVFTPILSAYLVFRFVYDRESSKSRKVALLASTSLIVFCLAVAVVGVYPSPEIRQPNDQVTNAEFVGMEWLFSQKDNPTMILDATPRTMIHRYADALRGVRWREERDDIFTSFPRDANMIPYHFGYDDHDRLNESFSSDRYMVLTSFDFVTYTTLWKGIGRLNETDFDMLQLDVSVSRVYSNGGLSVWVIFK
ncbi:MAG: hypothetical protein KAW09_04000 [Thermoplasmata archaeon]|nr:hypothetical protein [Thermoplasmata archaeon]